MKCEHSNEWICLFIFQVEIAEKIPQTLILALIEAKDLDGYY